MAGGEKNPNSTARDTLSRPLRDLRISVTDKCNLRCAYCMPEETYHENYRYLKRDQLLTFEETVRLATVFTGLGVTKIRVTGGEPLLRCNLPSLIAMLSVVPGVKDLALTTNGILLPRFASVLKEAGLDRVTISLDSIDEESYSAMTGGKAAVNAAFEGIRAAEEAGLGPVKINAVIKRNANDDAVVPLVERFRTTGHVLRFIEYMDVGTCNGWRHDEVVPSRELRDRIDAVFPIEPIDGNYDGEVAARYRYLDGAGEIGFISSVSEPFCGSCTRARLSADGTLYTCLFASAGLDLRTALRGGVDDATLAAVIGDTWRRRGDRYSERRAELAGTAQAASRIEMYHIGG